MSGSTISTHVRHGITLGAGGYASPLTIAYSYGVRPMKGSGQTGALVSLAGATLVDAGYVDGAAGYNGGPGSDGTAGGAGETGVSFAVGGSLVPNYPGGSGLVAGGSGGYGGYGTIVGGAGGLAGAALVVADGVDVTTGVRLYGGGGGFGGGGYDGLDLRKGGAGGAGGAGGTGVVLGSGAGLTNEFNIEGGIGGAGGAGGGSELQPGAAGRGAAGGAGVVAGADASVINLGLIRGGNGGYGGDTGLGAAGGDGVDLAAGASLLNSATVQPSIFGGTGKDGGAGGTGVSLAGGATVTNEGLIAGGRTGGDGAIVDAGATLANLAQGTLAGGSGGIGLVLEPGASMTNQGRIVGGYAGYFAHANGAGASIGAGAVLTNDGYIGAGYPSSYRPLAVGVAIAGGTVVNAGTIGATTVPAVSFYGGGLLVADAGAVFLGGIGGFTSGDTIELAGTVESYGTLAGGVLTLSGGTMLDLPGVAQVTVGSSGGDTVITACFASGTGIATARGRVKVEVLAVGDAVLTATGRLAPVRWIGFRRIDLRRHARPHDVMPVRVTAGAFGSSLPSQDLVLSPDHAVFADGHLVPIRYLINGVSIVQEARAAVTYWHLELDRHEVILAEGMACETYLDTGNRAAFEGEDAVMLHADFARRVWDQRGCAPILTDPADGVLRALHLRYLSRARLAA